MYPGESFQWATSGNTSKEEWNNSEQGKYIIRPAFQKNHTDTEINEMLRVLCFMK